MLRFCANISLLFRELPLLDRFQAARDAGFDAVEILHPYDIDKTALANAAHDTRMGIRLINTAFNPDVGDFGSGAIKQNKTQFMVDVANAVELSRTIGGPMVHVMAGMMRKQDSHNHMDCLAQNLHNIATLYPDTTFLIEPISLENYALNDLNVACDILNELTQPNLGLQFDTYHLAMLGYDIFDSFDRHFHQIKHIQISSTIARSEPDAGKIDHFKFFDHVAQSSYQGWIGAEYTPRATTLGGLAWLERAKSLHARHKD